jgi:transposase
LVTYEAGPTGFGLARVFAAAGIRCEVVAPSKLERPPGDRIKTDRRDARRLARLLHIGEISGIRIPTVVEEDARDLVRAREDARMDLMRARHRLSKLLLRQGIVYSGGRAWTGVHERWLRSQRFELPGTRAAFDEAFDAVLSTTARRDRLDEAIITTAALPEWAPMVARLGAIRGIATLTGLGLAVEIGDWDRFTGASIGAYLPGPGSLGVLHRSQPLPRVDHQDREHPCPAVVGRGGLAPSAFAAAGEPGGDTASSRSVAGLASSRRGCRPTAAPRVDGVGGPEEGIVRDRRGRRP